MGAFTQKIDFSGDCWTWTAAVQSSGYGCISIDGKVFLAHRVSYERYIGPIPEGLTIDHLCRNKLCVRPGHLEPVTLAENNKRRWDHYTECNRGHAMTEDNLRVHQRSNGRITRECKTCAKANARARYRKQAAA